jgi:mannose-6-phosphate isomerase-like protein (cupin superfamily)
MTDLSDAWLDGDPHARWRSGAVLGAGTGARAAGASLLELEEGCRLPRHTDSAEEVIVVVAGEAEVVIDGERSALAPGGCALVPELVPHEVRNTGAGVLRFAAVYAAPEVVTTYEAPVQPAGERRRTATA